jgi:hypothetical protein
MQLDFVAVLVAIFTMFALTYSDSNYQATSVMATSGKPQVYIDCSKMPDKIIIEALPLNVSQEYTLFLIDQNKRMENYTDHQFSGKAIALGNGEGFLNSTFPVASKVEDVFVGTLYAGDNTNSNILAQGVASCSNPDTANTNDAPASSISGLCADIIAKHKDSAAKNLTGQNCKPMIAKSIQ